jgi:Tol biopolymer transport system component
VLGGAIAGALAFVLRPAATVEEPRQRVTFEISPPPGTSFPGANSTPRFAVSPDGSSVAYQARVGTGNALFVRRLDAAEPRMVTGTESPNDTANQSVFWSPDGQSLGYFD